MADELKPYRIVGPAMVVMDLEAANRDDALRKFVERFNSSQPYTLDGLAGVEVTLQSPAVYPVVADASVNPLHGLFGADGEHAFAAGEVLVAGVNGEDMFLSAFAFGACLDLAIVADWEPEKPLDDYATSGTISAADAGNLATALARGLERLPHYNQPGGWTRFGGSGSVPRLTDPIAHLQGRPATVGRLIDLARAGAMGIDFDPVAAVSE